MTSKMREVLFKVGPNGKKRLLILAAASVYLVFAALAPAPPASRRPEPRPLRDNGDGTLGDLSSGRMWAQAVSREPLSWLEARRYCAELRLAGHADWRMPTLGELRTLYDQLGAHAPGLDRRAAPLQFNGGALIWSSTRFQSTTSMVMIYGFRTGAAGYDYKTRRADGQPVRLHVLPVRDISP